MTTLGSKIEWIYNELKENAFIIGWIGGTENEFYLINDGVEFAVSINSAGTDYCIKASAPFHETEYYVIGNDPKCVVKFIQEFNWSDEN